MEQTRTIILASNNKGKASEIKEILNPFGPFEILCVDEVIEDTSFLETVEEHDNYLDNAIAKARAAQKLTGYPCLSDDSGLEVDCLNLKPGVHSKRYAKTSIPSQDDANVDFLLSEIERVAGKNLSPEKRRARFICSVVLAMDGVLIHARGVLEGSITLTRSGTGGFGYDPIFVPDGYDRTLAELTSKQKNIISHRAKALQDLMNHAEQIGLVLVKRVHLDSQ